MAIETGGPAFPVQNFPVMDDEGFERRVPHYGLTLRDYFAAKAMPLAMEEYRMVIGRKKECLDLEWDKQNGLSSVAAYAYELADAMLEARK